MDTVNSNGQTELSMRGIGKITKRMDKEHFGMYTGTNTKVNGREIKRTVLVSTLT